MCPITPHLEKNKRNSFISVPPLEVGLVPVTRKQSKGWDAPDDSGLLPAVWPCVCKWADTSASSVYMETEASCFAVTVFEGQGL